ncbi:hypothetical protein NMY22_g17760 [Coprinellus aureogranulatus]|nr:hypothetical protein NMY22_g17760 [Coprinellus aureogranulatus]
MSAVRYARMNITVQDVVSIMKELGVVATCGSVVDALIALDIPLDLPPNENVTPNITGVHPDPSSAYHPAQSTAPLFTSLISYCHAASATAAIALSHGFSFGKELNLTAVNRQNTHSRALSSPSDSLPGHLMLAVTSDQICCRLPCSATEDIASYLSLKLEPQCAAFMACDGRDSANVFDNSSGDGSHLHDGDADSPMSDCLDRSNGSSLPSKLAEKRL